MLGTEAGRAELGLALEDLRLSLVHGGFGVPVRTVAGFSGYSDDIALRLRLEALVAHALQVPADTVRVLSDITLAYLDCFAPGAGCLVYAGTGSIAVAMDPDGRLHRAGGRGSLLDDGGSGYWIAREALQHIWRAEDEAPGSWSRSVLATNVFAQVGGSTWSKTRDFVYQGSRGQVGELALAVAVAARQGDAIALDILRRSGAELARLASVLVQRLGPRQVALAGRAAQLHPSILVAMRDALAGVAEPRQVELQSHLTAARMAATDAPILGMLADN
jgi:N-acetylglucosamine kinase-like BadF-type ATPase